MSPCPPRVVIRRPKVSEGGVRRVIPSTVLINGAPVPGVTALKINAAGDSLWRVTITIQAADVIFEDEE